MNDGLVKLIVLILGCGGLAWTIFELALHLRSQSDSRGRIFHFLIYLLVSAALFILVLLFDSGQDARVKEALPQAVVVMILLSVLALFVADWRRRTEVLNLSQRLAAAQVPASAFEDLKRKLGLNEVVAERDDRHYDQILRSAKSFYYCMGISLPDVTAYPFLNRLGDQLENNAGLHARFLLVNPFSWSALQKSRSAVYSTDPEGFIFTIAESVKRLRKWKKGLPSSLASRVSLRLYRCIPNTSIVMNEAMVNLSFYDEVRAGNRTPSFVLIDDPQVNPKGDLFEYYSRHYEAVWNRTDNIDGFTADLKAALDDCLDSLPVDGQQLRSLFRKAKARDLLE